MIKLLFVYLYYEDMFKEGILLKIVSRFKEENNLMVFKYV